MYSTLDILVNHHKETDIWFATPQTLMDKEDPNEEPDQSTFEGAHYNAEDNGEAQALLFAKTLGEGAVKTGQTRQAVVFHEGNERYYIDKDGTTERKDS